MLKTFAAFKYSFFIFLVDVFWFELKFFIFLPIKILTSDKKTLNKTQKGLTNMATNIVNLLTKVLANPTLGTGAITRTKSSSNPFASSGNPFVTSHDGNPFANYGQNKPVPGGYFAGYYNNQPNIVGRRLFIEV